MPAQQVALPAVFVKRFVRQGLSLLLIISQRLITKNVLLAVNVPKSVRERLLRNIDVKIF